LDGETEADYMARYLKTAGISEKQYTVENTSTNTGENFRNIAKLDVFQEAKSANLIGLLPTRALMTMRKEEAKTELPTKIVTLSNVIPLHGVSQHNWADNPIARDFVMAEFRKISPAMLGNYIYKGFCKNIRLKEEIRLANTLPHLPATYTLGKRALCPIV